MWPAPSPDLQGEGTLAPPKRPGPAPDMNVTPLVDICLVLLIIFMVVMPTLQNGGQVEVPGVHHPDPTKDESALTVTITAERRFLVEDKSLGAEALYTFLGGVKRLTPDRKLRLRGDRGLPYGFVRDVFARCQAMGFRGVALVVTSKTEAKKLARARSPRDLGHASTRTAAAASRSAGTLQRLASSG